MKRELEGALKRDFPALYRALHAPAARVSISGGIECGDGWALVVRRLSVKLEPFAAQTGAYASQVKEKMGSLRCYLLPLGALPEEIRTALADAFGESVKTCEECGAPGQTYRGVGRYGGRVQTLCVSCLEADRVRSRKWCEGRNRPEPGAASVVRFVHPARRGRP